MSPAVVVAIVVVGVGGGGSYSGRLSRSAPSPCIDTTLARVLVPSPQREFMTGASPCTGAGA